MRPVAVESRSTTPFACSVRLDGVDMENTWTQLAVRSLFFVATGALVVAPGLFHTFADWVNTLD